MTKSQTAALRQCNSANLPALVNSVWNSDTVHLNVIKYSGELVDVVLSSTDELIKLQDDDSTLSHLFEIAKDKSLISDDLPVFILIKVFSCVIKSCLLFQELSSRRLLCQSL